MEKEGVIVVGLVESDGNFAIVNAVRASDAKPVMLVVEEQRFQIKHLLDSLKEVAGLSLLGEPAKFRQSAWRRGNGHDQRVSAITAQQRPRPAIQAKRGRR